MQETNSFSKYKTNLQSFKNHEFLIVDEIIQYNYKKGIGIRAFIEVAEKASFITGVV